jgi:hypothetical protein
VAWLLGRASLHVYLGEYEIADARIERTDYFRDDEFSFPASFQWLAANPWQPLRGEFKLAVMELSMPFLEFFQLQQNGHAPAPRSSKHLVRE